MKNKGIQNKLKNEARHDFLRRLLFKEFPETHAVKQLGKFTLIQQLNRGTNRWEVAVWYTKDYERVQGYLKQGLFDKADGGKGKRLVGGKG